MDFVIRQSFVDFFLGHAVVKANVGLLLICYILQIFACT